ncbi:hypothetical protein [Haladaptatus sp. CMSO5]|uniref:hypothetical protein n=1 Tax=Haladaptatus sp. CMSO5 TaxID=3120514 RepID=UPI002FCE36BC
MSHLTMAVSEAMFNNVLDVLLDERVTTIDYEKEAEISGALTAGIDVEAHFELDAIDFRDTPDRIKIDELDVVYDVLDLYLDVDIDEICIGGFCIIPWFNGCAVRAPEICLFEADPDLHIPLSLGGIVRSEVSALVALTVDYAHNRGTMDYLTAQVEEHNQLAARPAGETGPLDPPVVNSWDVSFYPDTLDIDLLDVADIVGDLLESAIEFLIDDLLGWLPGWARDVLHGIFGSFVDIVRAALDLPDDLGEWLSDLIGVSLDFEGFLIEVFDEFLFDYPVFSIEDPFPVLDWSPPLGEPVPPGETRLIPVKVPIENLAIDLADTELVITMEVGN